MNLFKIMFVYFNKYRRFTTLIMGNEHFSMFFFPFFLKKNNLSEAHADNATHKRR